MIFLTFFQNFLKKVLDRGSEICYSLRAVTESGSEMGADQDSGPNLENDTERKKRARRKEAAEGRAGGDEGEDEAARDSEDSEEFRRSAEARDGRPEREGQKERKRTV